jgi:CRISPR-associated endonuclease Csn1
VYGRRYQLKRVQLGPNFKDVVNILNPDERKLVEVRIAGYKGNRRKALSDLLENPLLDPASGRVIKSVIVGYPFYTQRVGLSPSFKAAWVEDIISKDVQRAVRVRLAEGKPADTLRDLAKKPIWLNQETGVAVKRVRVRENVTEPRPLRTNVKGANIDFVQTRNNHHVTIFTDEGGNRREGEVVSLIDAVARKQDGEPVMRLHLPLRPDWEFLFSMRVNELFVFGLAPEEIDFRDPANYPLISEHLYRVQKLGSGDYTFRYHTATSLDDDLLAIRITSPSKLNCTKIRLSRANRIVSIGEQLTR